MGESYFSRSCLLKSQEICNHDPPPPSKPSPVTEHPAPTGQVAGTCPWDPLSPLLLVSSGQGRGRRRRISSFYCEHNFLPNSLHESPGDLCLFIYLAGSSFLKPRLMRVLRVGTDAVVAVRVAQRAFQLSGAAGNTS